METQTHPKPTHRTATEKKKYRDGQGTFVEIRTKKRATKETRPPPQVPKAREEDSIPRQASRIDRLHTKKKVHTYLRPVNSELSSVGHTLKGDQRALHRAGGGVFGEAESNFAKGYCQGDVRDLIQGKRGGRGRW